MFTRYTQTAIAVLHDIPSGGCLQSANFRQTEEEMSELLHKLETSGLVRRLPEQEEGLLSSYELCRPLHEIAVLDVIEATGEPINCKCPTPESFYIAHGRLAQKIGVANHMIRMFLSDVKISEW